MGLYAAMSIGIALLAMRALPDVIEARSRLALVPLRIFRNLGRSGAYLVMPCLGTAIMVLALVVAAIMIRVARQDLTGAQP